MKKTDLKNLSFDELMQREYELRKEMFDLNYQRKMGRVEKPHLFKQIKKEIARIKTFQHEKNTVTDKQEGLQNANKES